MRLDQIARRRLHAQQLLDSELTTAEQVVEHMLAVQAQDYPVAKWSLAQRATGILDADVDAALTAGTILRTHVLRPTWHFVRPADLRWLVELTAPRVRAVNASMERKLGLDDEVFARSNAALLSALAGGASLTRTEIASLLRARGIEAEGLRLGYLLMRPELDLLICSGPLRGKQQTYALLDERVPHPPASVSRDVALTQLVRRYLTSRGPATAKDLATWSSLPITTIRRALEATPGLAPATCGDRTYWAADLQRGRCRHVRAHRASAPGPGRVRRELQRVARRSRRRRAGRPSPRGAGDVPKRAGAGRPGGRPLAPRCHCSVRHPGHSAGPPTRRSGAGCGEPGGRSLRPVPRQGGHVVLTSAPGPGSRWGLRLPPRQPA